MNETLSASVGKGAETWDAGQSTCDYASEKGQVTVTVHHSTAKLDVAAEVAALKAAIPEAKLRDAPGLGVRAFFLDIPGAGTQLHNPCSDSDYLMISVLGFGNPADVAAQTEKLARRALARL